MNQLLLLTNNNVKESMRSVNRIGHFLYSRSYTLSELKMSFTLNTIKKRNECNPAKNTLSSNKPQRESRSCIP